MSGDPLSTDIRCMADYQEDGCEPDLRRGKRQGPVS